MTLKILMAEEAILGYLEKSDCISDSGSFASEHGLDHNDVVNPLKSLHGFRLVVAQANCMFKLDLLKCNYCWLNRRHTKRCFKKVDSSVYKIRFQQSMKKEWVVLEKKSQLVLRKDPDVMDKVKDNVKECLAAIEAGETVSQEDIEALKRRKLIMPQTWKGYSVRKGPNYAPKRKKAATDLTRENLQRGDWKELEFKEYNFNAKGQPVECGHLHPLLKVRKQLKMIFLQMGFEEMPTNNFVESSLGYSLLTCYEEWDILICTWIEGEAKLEASRSLMVKLCARENLLELVSGFVRLEYEPAYKHTTYHKMNCNINLGNRNFWNFDALFQPQQHPARDSHDTFFLQVPSTTKELPEVYVERVKDVHEVGVLLYGYDWKREEANKNLLRTHTTAVSSRMLYALAQKPFAPKKYFSIDRIFRNEAVDRTRLAEFHQIEGLICDLGLTLGDLIGVLHDFFLRLGMSKLRFKPAYNPYTEPSMEIFSYHEGFKKWVEIGNSGMFRPEMLRPMGLPEDVRVIAWGLSLEMPTMILYGYNNIRDLIGHKATTISFVDLGLIKKNPICRIGID
ncbi:hypothetical protein V2J09_016565 [Rumex salicifolius]